MPLACLSKPLVFRFNIAKRCPYIIKFPQFDTASAVQRNEVRKCGVLGGAEAGVEVEEGDGGADGDVEGVLGAGLGDFEPDVGGADDAKNANDNIQ